ncbi:MAG: hypothetical protein ACREUY_00160, partial [Burkholderiales bacterium]
MSAAPITLDFSKAQPIEKAVTLDFSKAQPIGEQVPRGTFAERFLASSGLGSLAEMYANPPTGIKDVLSAGLAPAKQAFELATAPARGIQASLEKRPEGIVRALSESVPGTGNAYDISTQTLRDIGERNYPALAGTTVGLGTQLALTRGIVRGAKGLPRISEIGRRPQVAQSVVKEAINLPPLAVSGAEDIFRAAAPTGTKVGFRSNLYAATGDLAEIGGKVDLKAARGGFRNPDMRPRATVTAINDHLKTMYQEERAPQIARHAQTPVEIKLGSDATEGLAKLEDIAATAETRSIIA